MLESLGILATFITLGVFLDSITTTEAKKRFFGIPSLKNSYGGGVANRLQSLAHILIETFFSQTTLPKALLVICTSSIAILLLVTTLQVTVLDRTFFSTLFDGLNTYGEKLLFLIVLLTFGLLTDVASFFESRVLIGLLPRCKSTLEIVVLIVSELLMTMVIFALFFALSITTVALFFGSRDLQSDLFVQMKDNTENSDIDFGDSNRPLILDDILPKSAHSALVLLRPKIAGSDFVEASSRIYSSNPISILELKSAIQLLSKDTFQIEELNVESGQLSYHNELTGISEFNYQLHGKIKLELPLNATRLNYYYTVAYQAADGVQDDFPASLMLYPGWYRTKLLPMTAESVLKDLPKNLQDFPVFCLAGPMKQIIATSEVSECSHWLVFSADIRDELTYAYIFWTTREMGNVPVYTFFYSSLTITMFLYVLFFFSYLVHYSGTLFELKAPGGSLVKTKELPFTLASGILGLFVSFLNLILS
jgi:hypothetical protein